MGVGYILVNYTQREQITFLHVGATKLREIAGNPAAACITAWYLLKHPGDNISFVPDTYGDWGWPFPSGSSSDCSTYTDMTDQVVAEIIDAKILVDGGKIYVDEDEPDTVFTRDLRNIWWDDEPS